MSQMASETEGKCTACGAKESEHGNSRHMFTTKPGELITKEEYDKQNTPQQVSIPYQGGPLGRLIEVLVTKKLMTLEEALYVAELGPRPDLSRYEGIQSW